MYNSKILVGIQVTLTFPDRHSSSNLPGPNTMELRHVIADLFEAHSCHFVLVYVVPAANFSKESKYYVLEMDTFISRKSRS